MGEGRGILSMYDEAPSSEGSGVSKREPITHSGTLERCTCRKIHKVND